MSANNLLHSSWPTGVIRHMGEESETFDSDFSVIDASQSDNVSCDFVDVNETNMVVSQTTFSDASLEEICSTIKNLTHENFQLKLTINKNGETLQSLNEIINNAEEKLQAVLKDRNDQREQTKLCIEQLRLKNNELKDILVQVQRDNIISGELKVREMKAEIESQKIYNCQLKADYDRILADYNHLKQNDNIVVGEENVSVELVDTCIAEFRAEAAFNEILFKNEDVSLLDLERTKLLDTEKELKNEKSKSEKLLKKMYELSNIIKKLSERQVQNDRKHKNHLQHMKACQEKEDSNHAKMILLGERLKNTTDELEKTRAEVLKLRNETETITLLQAQLDVYKSDFEEERRCRELLNCEKEQLVLELSLQNLATETYERKTAKPISLVQEKAAAFENSCPKCYFVFDSREPLFNHVNDCLDEEFT